MKESSIVAGLGELLWDIFPGRRCIGGAPANFAWHCRQLGAEAYPVSCIGAEALGVEMRAELHDMGVDTTYVLEDRSLPTGAAIVNLDEGGKASYEIVENVAWDHLTMNDELKSLAASLDAVCFGTLSQRSAMNRDFIRLFLQVMPEKSLKIFDVNFRQSLYSRPLVEKSLQLANVLKLSDEELGVMVSYFDLEGDTTQQLRQLLVKFDLRLVAYTRGEHGSLLLSADDSSCMKALPSQVVDSVGAGDSFTAALCMGLLAGWSLPEVNRFSNEVATFVCSQQGATPNLPMNLAANR
ncbi:MAG: carbohydrate kinase [Luteolibacter sp.]